MSKPFEFPKYAPPPPLRNGKIHQDDFPYRAALITLLSLLEREDIDLRSKVKPHSFEEQIFQWWEEYKRDNHF